MDKKLDNTGEKPDRDKKGHGKGKSLIIQAKYRVEGCINSFKSFTCRPSGSIALIFATSIKMIHNAYL